MAKPEVKQSESNLEKREAQLPEGVESTRAGREFLPATDIYETKEHVVIVADLPGVGAGDIDVTLERNLLTLRGRVREDRLAEGQLAYAEYEVGDFVRSFRLTGEVDRDAIEARTKDGVLTLTVPKVGPEVKRIEVATE